MREILHFSPQKLFIGILCSNLLLKEEVLDSLVLEFGPVDWESRELPFDYTDYYVPEMGGEITRYFLSFRDLQDPSRLADIKLTSCRIEENFTVEGKRKINLDPGLLALSRIVLATTKENAHRIALKQGIYAEITLLYHKKGYDPLPWTYPDFRTPEYHQIFLKILEIYRKQMKQ